MNGKGSKSRITDLKAYKANFDKIDWTEKKRPRDRMLEKFLSGLGIERGEFPK
jgi:hypothetical protein